MVIKKILNNNVLIAYSDQQDEVVLMGKGLSYGRKVGDIIDKSAVAKIFELKSNSEHKKLLQYLEDIPIAYFTTADRIVRLAGQLLTNPLNDMLLLALADHIHFSVERYRSGTPLRNKLLWEMKHFYKAEFQLALDATAIINQEFDVALDEHEAGFLTTHFVNAQMEDEVFPQVTTMIQEVLGLVRFHFQLDYDEESLDYHRFVTHLRYFAQRVFSRASFTSDDDDLLDMVKEKYTEAYLCALKIAAFVEQQYAHQIDNEEILYLSIHIARLIRK